VSKPFVSLPSPRSDVYPEFVALQNVIIRRMMNLRETYTRQYTLRENGSSAVD